MNTKILIPVAGLWFASVGAAYYLGNSNSLESSSSTDTASSSLGKQDAGANKTLSTHSSSDYSRRSARRNSPVTLGGSSRSASLSINEINQITDPLARSRHLLDLIDTMAPEDFASALADFNKANRSGKRFAEYAILLNAWGKVDPTGALAYAQSSDRPQYSTKEVLASWAGTDSDAALKWARENHSGDAPNPWLTGIIKGVVNTDPTLATTILQELPYSNERGEALQEIIPHIAKLGPTQANTWLNGIEDPQLRQGATKYLASSLSIEDPKAAAQWTSSISDSAQRQSAVSKVMQNWAKQDPTEAMAWLETLPAEEQASAEPQFIGSYAAADPNAAADWLDERAESENYQDLLEKFARGTTQSDPVLALNYGNELENERSRSRTVGRALWTLYRQDQASAQEWIQNNELPDRVKRHVNRMMGDQ